MLTTLLFLEFYNKRLKEKPESMLEKNRKLHDMRKNKIDGHSDWVIALYLENASKYQFAQDFISRICFAPRNMSNLIGDQKALLQQFENILLEE